MFNTSARNSMLTGLVPNIGFAGLTSTFPGQSNTGELTGGTPAYARKTITYGAAANGQILSTNAPTFDVPAGGVVTWIIFCAASSAGVVNACAPNGAQPKEFVTDVSLNNIVCEGHGYAANQQIVFTGDTAPGGLTEGTIYYAVTPTLNTFQVSATSGGGPITLTGQAGGACLVSRIVVETFSAQGTFTLNANAILSLNY